MDDKRAALVLAGLALAGAAVKLLLAPPVGRAPGDVTLTADTAAQPAGLRATALEAARLARPLAPGERVDLDLADVTEITRLPRLGPALARRIVDWRATHGPFGSLARLDSVSGIGPHLLDAIRPYVMFSGSLAPRP
ncbi:MAG TPA: helix-hairpin-helix domain-containing protein [Gemmatimonadales bacterium]